MQEGGIEPDLAVPQLSDEDLDSRPVFREADLRRHLINTAKADNALLEDDEKTDPAFDTNAEALKKKGIEDFQLNYAVQTLARLGDTRTAAAK